MIEQKGDNRVPYPTYKPSKHYKHKNNKHQNRVTNNTKKDYKCRKSTHNTDKFRMLRATPTTSIVDPSPNLN